MKNLKTYKLFESAEEDENIVSTIKDILLEINDIGYETEVTSNRYGYISGCKTSSTLQEDVEIDFEIFISIKIESVDKMMYTMGSYELLREIIDRIQEYLFKLDKNWRQGETSRQDPVSLARFKEMKIRYVRYTY